MYRVRAGETLILASSSPRRKELLKECGLQFTIQVADANEDVVAGESAQQMVERLAELKARTIATRHADAWVIGADTTVMLDGEIFGKPVDGADAVRMISRLRGRVHYVWGGFCVMNQVRGISHVESVRTSVEMQPLTKEEIESYVATGEPLDKAGAYAIQGIGAQLVNRVEGSYTNIVGLPISALLTVLKKYAVVELA